MEKLCESAIKKLEPLWAGNAKKSGYYRWYSGYCQVDYIGAVVNGIPKWCAVTVSNGEEIPQLLLPPVRPNTYRALDFDAVYASCPYAADSENNNGYGCSHPKQEATAETEEGEEEGLCYCWSCPLGISFNPSEDEEDAYSLIHNPYIYWDDGFTSMDGKGPSADDINDSGCLLVCDDKFATESDWETISRHNRYLNRYNPEKVVPEGPLYQYQMHANPCANDEDDRCFIQAYRCLENGKLRPEQVILVGSVEECRANLDMLEAPQGGGANV